VTKKTPKEKAGGRAFKFRVELDFEVLSCWRILVVLADYSFLDFHVILQEAFNWLDYHLFNFRMKHKGNVIQIADLGLETIDSMFADIFGSKAQEEIDAREIFLDDIFPKTKTAMYSYDYGDGWVHKIKLLETIEDYGNSEPICIDGFGDAPPEDVGAEGGFLDFLDTISDKKNPEYKDMVEWGKSQQFEKYDLPRINAKLSEWREHMEFREQMLQR
jgi:hypothetical protein